MGKSVLVFLRKSLFWSFVFFVCFSAAINLPRFTSGDPTLMQLISALSAFALVCGFGGFFEILRDKIVWLEELFFGSVRNLYLFSVAYMAVAIFSVLIASCLFFKWSHYSDIKFLVENYEKNSIREFMEQDSNRLAIRRVSNRFPERRDWQAALDYLVTQARNVPGNNDSFRELSLFIVSSIFGVSDVKLNTPSNEEFEALTAKRPFCWCGIDSELDTRPHHFVFKMLAQGFSRNPTRGNMISRSWIAQDSNNEELQIYGHIIDMSERFLEMYTSLQVTKTEPSEETISSLKTLVTKIESKLNGGVRGNFNESDFYFLSLDFLAQAQIYLCMFNENRDDERIFVPYQRFLTARRSQMAQDSRIPKWSREPAKFMLYWQINTAAKNLSEHGANRTLEFFDQLCPGYFQPLIDRLNSVFPDLAGEHYWEHWRRNTIASISKEDVNVRIFNPSETIGWRY